MDSYFYSIQINFIQFISCDSNELFWLFKLAPVSFDTPPSFLADWILEDSGERKRVHCFPPSILLWPLKLVLGGLRFSKIRVSINSPSSVIPALNRALNTFPYLSPQAYEPLSASNSARSHVPQNNMWFPSPCHSLLESLSPLPSWVSHLLPAGTLPGEMVDGRESVSQGDRGHPTNTEETPAGSGQL